MDNFSDSSGKILQVERLSFSEKPKKAKNTLMSGDVVVSVNGKLVGPSLVTIEHLMSGEYVEVVVIRRNKRGVPQYKTLKVQTKEVSGYDKFKLVYWQNTAFLYRDGEYFGQKKGVYAKYDYMSPFSGSSGGVIWALRGDGQLMEIETLDDFFAATRILSGKKFVSVGYGSKKNPVWVNITLEPDANPAKMYVFDAEKKAMGVRTAETLSANELALLTKAQSPAHVSTASDGAGAAADGASAGAAADGASTGAAADGAVTSTAGDSEDAVEPVIPFRTDNSAVGTTSLQSHRFEMAPVY
jgi:hypothetical protein